MIASLLLLAGVACDARTGRERAEVTPADAAVDLTGAGATFPYPLYARWFSDYAKASGVRINYQSIGSGGGLRQLAAGTVDFAASERPVPSGEGTPDPGDSLLYIPMVAGAVAVTYHLPELSEPLRLDGATLAAIYLGRIRRWDHPRLAALNPGARLPARDILVATRADASGTTFIATSYLAKVSRAWAAGPGTGLQVRWPVGVGNRGNEGVAGQVKQTPGAIGLVELTYARQNRLPTAAVRNAAGQFVRPDARTIDAALRAVLDTLPAGSDYRVSLVDAGAPNAYPITSLTWLVINQRRPDPAKRRALRDFVAWAWQEGGARRVRSTTSPCRPSTWRAPSRS